MTIQQLERRAFFEDHAHIWDDICNHDEQKIDEIMSIIDIQHGDNVLDVGTGTGILIPHIMKRVTHKGNIVALDYSENMIRKAQEKYPGSEYCNVSFIIDDFFALESEYKFDAVICYSCFPHFDDKRSFFHKAFEILNQNGYVLIAHSESREKINAMHVRKHQAVRGDYLPSAEKIITFAEEVGFIIKEKIDHDDLFCLLFEK